MVIQSNCMKAVVFIGRGLREYIDMFNLDPLELEGTRILDCAAGVSSFRSEMHDRGFNVTALDPLYRRTPDEIKKMAYESFRRYTTNHRDFLRDLKVDGRPVEDYRRMVLSRFLDDYKRNPSWYIAGELPDLPFEDGEFDLVVSANFLFLYEDLLDYSFHAESVREMLRIGKEVRIFPVYNIHRRKRSVHLKPLMDEFNDYDMKIRKVKYHEETGCNEMLIIK
ncbi:hypothetical protein tca_01039 [Methanothermobacter sp. EMTCatA1]|nr:hypothetical protein tca_01039 [Methanothermobacter sp. EMTCatA1]